MPFKTKEDKRTYQRNYMQRKRQLEKQREIKEYYKRNPYGFKYTPYQKERYPSYKQCKESDPSLKFRDWLEDKQIYDKEHKDDGKELEHHIFLTEDEANFWKGLGMTKQRLVRP